MLRNKPNPRNSQRPTPAMEQYVEAIATLLTRDRVTSISDIAAEAGVSRPAASRSVRELTDSGLVEHKAYGYVTLTDKGFALADRLAARHQALRKFFEAVLMLDVEAADAEACRLEHQVSDSLAQRFSRLADVAADNAIADKIKAAYRGLD